MLTRGQGGGWQRWVCEGGHGMGDICKRVKITKKKERKGEACFLFADCKSGGNIETVG